MYATYCWFSYPHLFLVMLPKHHSSKTANILSQAALSASVSTMSQPQAILTQALQSTTVWIYVYWFDIIIFIIIFHFSTTYYFIVSKAYTFCEAGSECIGGEETKRRNGQISHLWKLKGNSSVWLLISIWNILFFSFLFFFLIPYFFIDS